MDSVALDSREYYLKGNWRHWFWALFAIFLVSYAPGYIDKAKWDETAIFLFVGFQSLLISGGFATLYLVYGIKNKVKVFKVIFFILAALQLPWLLNRFFTDSSVIDILFFDNLDNSDLFPIVLNGTFYFNYAVAIVNIAFFVIVACMKKTNTLLCISTIIAAAVSLVALVSPTVINTIGEQYCKTAGFKAFSSFVSLASYIRLGLHWSSLIFFFAAMSFSKMKVKVDPAKEVEAN